MKLFTAPPLSQFADAPAKPRSPAPVSPAPTPVAPTSSAAAVAASTPAASAPGAKNARRAVTTIPETPARLRLTTIPRMAAGGRWRVETMRALSEPMLVWITRGQGRLTLGGITRGYAANNAIFIPAGVMHAFDLGPQTHGTVLYFGRACDVTLPAASHHLRLREPKVQSELTGLLDAVAREMESDRPASDRALRHHLGLLGVWLERQVETAGAGANAPRLPAPRRLAARYAAALEGGFRKGLNVADFAAELGVTPTHLTRACREACGRSASQMLRERRLHEARRLLRDTRAPVGEIAASLGFASAAYFTRAFHAETGQTPSDFRRGV
ncbi:AraC family transcriptional regulator [Phaeovulum vinaykumarii]|uniref:AraC-type DNA-binding protein n=1 Tax=Phaeovulum vinaykumarii TaxID=407234 RepID=A0A1N7MUP9_9RHOB|nr:AraC family transcriptional regulator [Phaeovulum vinaykumarii]SIS89865.1 AraC-type DNA-binding protein [Phaeovulum vinaykumarii]SOC16997.1 AraC-like DNA-binding protein [Phaeovulum vinaykumarii]